VIESGQLLFLSCLFVQDICLKFQVLAGLMSQCLILFWQRKSVNKGIGG
jgi:hypothetical protein